MHDFKLKKCPLELDELQLLLECLSASGHVNAMGDLEIRFDETLPGDETFSRFVLLREYFLGLKHRDPLHMLIDTDEQSFIDGDYMIENSKGIPHRSGDSVSLLSDNRTQKVFKIEAFSAFGSGLHDTTHGCMELIRVFSQDNDNREKIRVLDIGTGTGILSVYSCIQGMEDITAVDTSIRAIISAFHNFHINNLTERITLKHGSIGDVGEGFGLVIANIYPSVIVKIFDTIYNKTIPGGSIILSGIKRTEADIIFKVLSRYPALNILKKLVKGKWICLYVIKE